MFRIAQGAHISLLGLAISELIYSVMEITEEEKCIDWTGRIFSHLAGLVIRFVVDCIVRLSDIISKLNTKVRNMLTFYLSFSSVQASSF